MENFKIIKILTPENLYVLFCNNIEVLEKMTLEERALFLKNPIYVYEEKISLIIFYQTPHSGSNIHFKHVLESEFLIDNSIDIDGSSIFDHDEFMYVFDKKKAPKGRHH